MRSLTLETQTQPDPPAPSAILPPTPEEIDQLIENYDILATVAATAATDLKDAKEGMIFLIDSFGVVPTDADKSKRLTGAHHIATVTRGSSVTINEPAVISFKLWLQKKGYGELFSRFFAPQTEHSLVNGARDVLKTLDMPKTISEKIASLFGLTIDVKVKAASLKIEAIKPEKPVRQPRGSKAAA